MDNDTALGPWDFRKVLPFRPLPQTVGPPSEFANIWFEGQKAFEAMLETGAIDNWTNFPGFLELYV